MKKSKNKTLVKKELVTVSKDGFQIKCQQSTEGILFPDEKEPQKETVFLKIIPLKNHIYEVYRLNGQCYFYDAKRKQIIGIASEQFDMMDESFQIIPMAGNLYQFSTKNDSYLYDSALKDMIGTNPKLYHIDGAVNQVKIEIEQGMFLYDKKTCRYLSPVFDHIGVFKTISIPNTKYKSIEAPFTTFLDESRENHIDGKIDVNGAFIGDLTAIIDGEVTLHSLEDNYASFDLIETKDYYQLFIENCKKNIGKRKKR